MIEHKNSEVINDETIQVPTLITLSKFVKELDSSIHELILHDRTNHLIKRCYPSDAAKIYPRTKVLNYFVKDKETLDVFLKI